jgi:hypothetical protein
VVGEWLLAVVIASSGVRSPEFEHYAAEAPLAGAAATPSMSLAKARKFQTVLRQAAQQGPNFNGHYRAVHWGQGTNIIEWAVIDLRTGTVWFAPEPAGSCWVPFKPDDTDIAEWYEVHVDSALLYLHGCRAAQPASRTFDTRSVYVWDHGRARLIRTEALAK